MIVKKIIILLFLSLFISSCFEKNNSFELDINEFLNLKVDDVCKMNSLLFYKDFLKLMRESSGSLAAKKLADEILSDPKKYELISIKFDFDLYDSNKNLTFNWDYLKGIFGNEKNNEDENFFYLQFYIKGTHLFAQFNKNNTFNKNIYSYYNDKDCNYPLIEKTK